MHNFISNVFSLLSPDRAAHSYRDAVTDLFFEIANYGGTEAEHNRVDELVHAYTAQHGSLSRNSLRAIVLCVVQSQPTPTEEEEAA